MDDLFDKIVDSTFDAVLKTLDIRSKDEKFSIENTQKELESFYLYEGQDWGGRGDTKQAEIEGAIMAYQVFIDRYNKKENIKYK